MDSVAIDQLLRIIVENEVRQRLQPNAASVDDAVEFELLLRPGLALQVQFAMCHRENRSASGTQASSTLPTATAGFGSIASAVHVSLDNRVVISEDASVVQAPPTPTSSSTRFPVSSAAIAKATRLRKCHSSDDISAIVAANSCIVEKPIVEAVEPSCPDEYAQLLQVGDVLEAIDGIATGASISCLSVCLTVCQLCPESVNVERTDGRLVHVTACSVDWLRRSDGAPAQVRSPCEAPVPALARKALASQSLDRVCCTALPLVELCRCTSTPLQSICHCYGVAH